MQKMKKKHHPRGKLQAVCTFFLYLLKLFIESEMKHLSVMESSPEGRKNEKKNQTNSNKN